MVFAEEYPAEKSQEGGNTQRHTQASLEELTLPELVTLLTEMVSISSPPCHILKFCYWRERVCRFFCLFVCLFFVQMYCPIGISPMENLGCFSQEKPAAAVMLFNIQCMLGV